MSIISQSLVKVPCCTTLRVLHHDHSQLPPLYVSSTTTASSHGCTMHSTCPPRPRPAHMGTLRVLHDHGQLLWALYVSSTTTASSHACTTLRVLHDHSHLPCVHRSTCPPRPQPSPMREPLYVSSTTTASSHACTTLRVTTASSHACTALRVLHDHSQLPCICVYPACAIYTQTRVHWLQRA